jgi:hypothetical protein
MPLLPFEDIAQTYSDNNTILELFQEHQNWTHINSEDLDRIARDSQQFSFLVMSCDISDSNCAFNLGKVKDLAHMFGHNIQLFFMDIIKNKIYLKGFH